MAIGVPVDILSEELHEFRPLGAWPDQAHLAAQHVDELGQLVERRLAQQAPDAGAAVLAFHPAGSRADRGLEAIAIAIAIPAAVSVQLRVWSLHRPELENLKFAPIEA